MNSSFRQVVLGFGKFFALCAFFAALFGIIWADVRFWQDPLI